MDIVLITGASSGIGASIARWFSQEKPEFHLLLHGRDEKRLLALQAEIKNTSDLIIVDLKRPDALFLFMEAFSTYGYPSIFVNNAGYGYCGKFEDQASLDLAQLIQVNSIFPLQICQALLPKLKQVLHINSTGAYVPGPLTATYYAAKSLSHSAFLALALERKDIHFCLVVAGAVHSNFAQNAGRKAASFAMPSAKLARLACKALFQRKKMIIPGLANKLFVLAAKILPATWLAKLVYRYQRALTDDKPAD